MLDTLRTETPGTINSTSVGIARPAVSGFLQRVLPCAFFLATSALATILPADRVFQWQGNVGVPGGIPTRTVIYKNMVTAGAKSNGSADCSAILQNAINSCPPNQVIYFPAGTYRIDNLISNLTRSNITIRGAGMGKTRLMLRTGGGNGAFNIGTADWPKPPAAFPITAGANAGSRTVSIRKHGDDCSRQLYPDRAIESDVGQASEWRTQ